MLKSTLVILYSLLFVVSCGGSGGGNSNTDPNSKSPSGGPTVVSLDPVLFFDICSATACSQGRLAQVLPSTANSFSIPLSDQYYAVLQDSNAIAHSGSKIFFSAQVDMAANYQLFEYDFDSDEIRAIASSAQDPKEFIIHNQKLYFSASDAINGRELWVYDLENEVSSLFLDINSGSQDSSPRNFISIGNKLYFTATDASHGEEIRALDTSIDLGGNNPRVADIFAGTNSGLPSRMQLLGEHIYFSGFETTNGVETWVLDTSSTIDLGATTPNPKILVDLEPGLSSTFPNNYSLLGGKVYFTATTSATGSEVWMYDPSTGSTPIAIEVISGSQSSQVTSLISVNDKLFFNADSNTGSGEELWMYDPAIAINATNPGLVIDLESGSDSSSPEMLIGYGDYLYFMATDITNGRELRILDTNTLALPLVIDYTVGSESSVIKNFYFAGQ